MSTFKNTEILYVIDTIAREKSISADELFNALEGVIEATAKMQYGASENIAVHLDKKSGNIEVYRILKVITDDEYEAAEDRTGLIPLTLAYRVRVDIVPGEAIEESLPPLDMSRMSAYEAKKLIIKKLKEMGFKIKLVLADSEYGESEENFVSILNKEKLNFVLAIRSNHIVWVPSGQRVRYNKWREFDRIFSTGKIEKR